MWIPLSDISVHQCLFASARLPEEVKASKKTAALTSAHIALTSAPIALTSALTSALTAALTSALTSLIQPVNVNLYK